MFVHDETPIKVLKSYVNQDQNLADLDTYERQLRQHASSVSPAQLFLINRIIEKLENLKVYDSYEVVSD